MCEQGSASEPESPATSSRRYMLVGARREAGRIVQFLQSSEPSGIRVVGFVAATGRGRRLRLHAGVEPLPVLGPIERLAELVRQFRPTDLVVALTGSHARLAKSTLAKLEETPIRVHWLRETERAGRPEKSLPHRRYRRQAGLSPRGSVAKRALDLLGAGIGLIVLSPLFAVVSALILVTSGRPIFYTQERVGQGGRRFRIIKFRSMRKDAEDATGPIWASDRDGRCTSLGEWLRRTNIDELPQLWNVLIGEMSLVGPRPERPMFVERFRSELSHYDDRHAMPMGMTGWAQVHGWRGRTSLDMRLQFDLDYIRQWSIGLDIRILFMTVGHVAFRKVSWDSQRPSADAGLSEGDRTSVIEARVDSAGRASTQGE
jgi:exopolysaccharide biosynthesis polyprenyl glycosylphosphotransferase